MTRTVLAFTACAIALVACRRHEQNRSGVTNLQPLGDKVGDTLYPDAIAAVANPPGVQPPDCPEGYTAHTYPPWCIALPSKSFRPGPLFIDGDTTGHIDYSRSADVTLRVFYTIAPYHQVVDMARLFMQSYQWLITGEGEFAGGHWLSGKDNDGLAHLVAVARGKPPFTIRCDAIAKAGSDEHRRLADSCNSLVVP
jgi:hypothetical protein